MTKSRGILGPRVPWSDQQLADLCKLYPDNRAQDLVERLGHTQSSIYQQAQKLGLTKSEAFKASPLSSRLRQGSHPGSKATQFKPGQVSWNKGKTYKPGGRCAETQFKKGGRTGRAVEVYKPVGTERLSKGGYLERKIHDGMPLQSRWCAVHLILWEKANGPLPKGHALVFKDRDKKNIRLDNLELITRAELMRRNSLHNLPAPLPELIQLRGALNRKINSRRKASVEEHQ